MMKSKWKRIILDLVFIIVLAATITAFVISLMPAPDAIEDDIWGPGFGIFICIFFFIPVIALEIDAFFGIRYFLLCSDKRKGKTVVNAISCILPIAAMVCFPLTLIMRNQYLLYIEILWLFLWIWILIYLPFRVIYFIVGKVKSKG